MADDAGEVVTSTRQLSLLVGMEERAMSNVLRDLERLMESA